MRSLFVLVAIEVFAGCTGDQVGSAVTDASVDSAAIDDTSAPVDSAASDAAVADTSDAAMADTSDASCPTYSPNKIPEGDFAGGFGAWQTSDCSKESVAGPCGKALRMYDIKSQARVGVSYPSKPIPLGTKLHLRAWFKKGTQATPSSPPKLFMRRYFMTDAGEKYNDDFAIFATLTDKWTLVERVFTTEIDQTAMEAILDVYVDPTTTPYDLMVADVSLVEESP